MMDDFTAYILKGAEVSGTSAMPLSAPPAKTQSPTKTIPKTAAVASEVDVSDKQPPRHCAKVASVRFALPALNLYPIDSYAQVKTANAYFAEHFRDFSPSLRREFALHVAVRSEELGIKTAQAVADYGAKEAADPLSLQLAIEGRRSVVTGPYADVLDGVKEAALRVSPEEAAALLEQFDEGAGITHLYGQHILDPFLSAFGVKTAELSNTPHGSIVIGNDYMAVDDLKDFAMNRRPKVEVLYGAEFATDFQKDPVGIFNSLPKPQQKVLMRMVGDNRPSEAVAS